MSEELERRLAEAEKLRLAVERRRNLPVADLDERKQLLQELKQATEALTTRDAAFKKLVEALLTQDSALLDEQAKIELYKRMLNSLRQQFEESQTLVENDLTVALSILRDASSKLDVATQQLAKLVDLKTANLELERKALNKLLEEL